QHSNRRQGRSHARARDALAAGRSLLHGKHGEPSNLFSACPLPTLRERSVRVSLSSSSHQSQLRRLEQYGLQPLRGNSLLFKQLSLQGSAFQFSAIRRLGNTES